MHDYIRQYDATGQQTLASTNNTQQVYDGDRLRVKKVENGQAKYYLRSSILGGQVVCEINQSGGWTKGFVYGTSGELLAIQENNAISFVHSDPVTKSQKITNSSGNVASGVDVDPWGGETSKSFNPGTHARKYTTYERDANGDDEAQQRKYKGNLMRFTQPDPFDGSMSLADPQSLNRYAYVGNDPVNFTDPTGLNAEAPDGTPCQLRNGNGTTTPGIMYGGRCRIGESVTTVGDNEPRWLAAFRADYGLGELPLVYRRMITLRMADDFRNSPRDGAPTTAPQQQRPTPQPCDLGFFVESNPSGGFSRDGRSFTGADLNTFGRLIYAESSNNDNERAAVASVIYNRLSNARPTFTAVANSGQFEAVTGPDTRAFDRTAPSVAGNLAEGDCNALRASLNTVQNLMRNGPSYPQFGAFRGGRTPIREGITLIGNSRFAASDAIFNPPRRRRR